jgi:hypothetical protein
MNYLGAGAKEEIALSPLINNILKVEKVFMIGLVMNFVNSLALFAVAISNLITGW